MIHLLELNPALDSVALSAIFARDGRVQVRDVLTPSSARAVQHMLRSQTPWGIAWQASDAGPQALRQDELRGLSAERRHALAVEVQHAARRGDYAFRFGQYRILDGYLAGWNPGGPHDVLLEHINDAPMLDLVRAVTGMPGLIKADAQATMFAAGDFLSAHTDSHVAQGWQVAYVLNFADPDWNVDWGGYLNFLDEEGDVVTGWKPRFNALNLFRVPQRHNVSYVPAFAPAGRVAITGWFRDR